jgi:hypothetical protein
MPSKDSLGPGATRVQQVTDAQPALAIAGDVASASSGTSPSLDLLSFLSGYVLEGSRAVPTLKGPRAAMSNLGLPWVAQSFSGCHSMAKMCLIGIGWHEIRPARE